MLRTNFYEIFSDNLCSNLSTQHFMAGVMKILYQMNVITDQNNLLTNSVEYTQNIPLHQLNIFGIIKQYEN